MNIVVVNIDPLEYVLVEHPTKPGHYTACPF